MVITKLWKDIHPKHIRVENYSICCKNIAPWPGSNVFELCNSSRPNYLVVDLNDTCLVDKSNVKNFCYRLHRSEPWDKMEHRPHKKRVLVSSASKPQSPVPQLVPCQAEVPRVTPGGTVLNKVCVNRPQLLSFASTWSTISRPPFPTAVSALSYIK